MAYLCGQYEFPVRWLDFGPYPSVCICTVAAAAPLFLVHTAFFKSHNITIQEVDSTDWLSGHVKYTYLIYTR